MKRTLLIAAALGLASCRGTVPQRDAQPQRNISAILIGGRMILPSGETRNATTFINFESEAGSQAEAYRLPIKGQQSGLYLVEPGSYRFAPTRSLFGFSQTKMAVSIEGRDYLPEFPRDLQRLNRYAIKPSKVVALGILEVRVMPALPGQKPEVRVSLDDSVSSRRRLVQETIHAMMDPNRSLEARESAVSWSQGLQDSLLEILSEENRRSPYSPDR